MLEEKGHFFEQEKGLEWLHIEEVRERLLEVLWHDIEV